MAPFRDEKSEKDSSEQPRPAGPEQVLRLPRQARVAELVVAGYSNREIASELGLSEQVVKNVLHSVFDRLGVWNRVELARRFAWGLSSDVQRIEAERLAELHRRQILDSTAERIFDELAALAASVFEVSIALVALTDSSRIWFKSNIGLCGSEVPREATICHHTIQQSELLVVSDRESDDSFGSNPHLKDFGVRFYAAAPILTADGYSLGVVCIVDHKTRTFSRAQGAILQSLARVAGVQIELPRRLHDLQESTG